MIAPNIFITSRNGICHVTGLLYAVDDGGLRLLVFATSVAEDDIIDGDGGAAIVNSGDILRDKQKLEQFPIVPADGCICHRVH